MLNSYLGFSTLVFLFLAVIWKRDDIFNLMLKFVLAAAFVWGLIETLLALGYVVHG